MSGDGAGLIGDRALGHGAVEREGAGRNGVFQCGELQHPEVGANLQEMPASERWTWPTSE